MKTDRELLELAAKAAGFLNWTPYNAWLFIETGHSRCNTGYHWNPLTDDGDALRLAVKLLLDVNVEQSTVDVYNRDMKMTRVWASEFPDAYAATRRAIVRAAAAIGEAMP